MAETKSINLVENIGMDTSAPYGVYVNGEQVAVYQSESEAEAHYQTLLGRGIPPKDLLEHFTPAEGVRIELVRADGDFRLWRSTVTRTLGDCAALEVAKFHITERNDVVCLFMSR